MNSGSRIWLFSSCGVGGLFISLVYWIPAPLIWFSSLRCHIWGTQMTDVTSPQLAALGFSSLKGKRKGSLINHYPWDAKGWLWPPCYWGTGSGMTCSHSQAPGFLHHNWTLCQSTSYMRGLMNTQKAQVSYSSECDKLDMKLEWLFPRSNHEHCDHCRPLWCNAFGAGTVTVLFLWCFLH